MASTEKQTLASNLDLLLQAGKAVCLENSER